MVTEIKDPWIYTYTGQKVHLFDPDPETILLQDIAHALANICRWGGHCMFYYSVAQHSVLVSRYCDPKDAMAGLMHDAAEAYVGDICRPLKRSYLMDHYMAVYDGMERVIMQKFCGIDRIPESVKAADERILNTEALALMRRRQQDIEGDEWLCEGDPIEDLILNPSSPEHDRQGFLQRFYRISAINPGVAP